MGRGNSDWVGKSPEAKQKAGRGGDKLRVGCAELAERWVWGGRGHPVTEKSGLDLSGREGKARGGKGGEGRKGQSEALGASYSRICREGPGQEAPWRWSEPSRTDTQPPCLRVQLLLTVLCVQFTRWSLGT